MGNVREIIMQGNEVTPFPFVDPGDKRRRRLHFASLNELLQQPVPPVEMEERGENWTKKGFDYSI